MLAHGLDTAGSTASSHFSTLNNWRKHKRKISVQLTQWKVGYCVKIASYFKFEICKALPNSQFPSIREAWPEPASVLVFMEHDCVEMKGITRLYCEQCAPKNQFVKAFYAQLYFGFLHPLLNLQVEVLCMILRRKKITVRSLCSHRANLSLVFPDFFPSLPLFTTCFLPHPPRKFIAPLFYSIESWHTHFHKSCGKMPPFWHGNGLLLPLRGISALNNKTWVL